MAEFTSNSENLMGSMDLQMDLGLIPTLLMMDSRTQLIHLEWHSAFDREGLGRAVAGRGIPTLQLHSYSCILALAGVPSAFGPFLYRRTTKWDTEIFIEACRLCVGALGHTYVAMADWWLL